MRKKSITPHARPVAAVGLLLALSLVAGAQPSAPDDPATPTTAPRRALAVPSGFKIVTVARRSILCQEGDEPWIRLAVGDIRPTTRPTTMPADLLERLSERRDVLAERIAADLGLPDTSAPKRLVDEQLVPLLRRAAVFDPPVFYMVASETTVRDLLKAGWENPRFRYNRAADRIIVDPRVQMSLTESVDDTIVPALYEPDDDVATRSRRLREAIETTEGRLGMEVAIQSEYSAQLSFVAFVGETVIRPLDLKPDQDWFGVGLSGVLSAKYLAIINGMEEREFLDVMTTDRRGNPIRSATVDLLNPTPLDDLRPAARPAYADAFRRKSSAVVLGWLDRLPPGGLAKAIAALKAAPPADGPALVKVLADVTGIDLTDELRPR
jgi:hypothetical protein